MADPTGTVFETRNKKIACTASVFLANRTNGRVIRSVASVVVVCRRLCRYVLWLNGAS